jgi:hypothetical protein
MEYNPKTGTGGITIHYEFFFENLVTVVQEQLLNACFRA